MAGRLEQGGDGRRAGVAGVDPAFEAEDERRVLEARPALDRRESHHPPIRSGVPGKTVRADHGTASIWPAGPGNVTLSSDAIPMEPESGQRRRVARRRRNDSSYRRNRRDL